MDRLNSRLKLINNLSNACSLNAFTRLELVFLFYNTLLSRWLRVRNFPFDDFEYVRRNVEI